MLIFQGLRLHAQHCSDPEIYEHSVETVLCSKILAFMRAAVRVALSTELMELLLLR